MKRSPSFNRRHRLAGSRHVRTVYLTLLGMLVLALLVLMRSPLYSILIIHCSTQRAPLVAPVSTGVATPADKALAINSSSKAVTGTGRANEASRPAPQLIQELKTVLQRAQQEKGHELD
eukprot:jgi/Chrzof1/12729/Cz07g05140.t1